MRAKLTLTNMYGTNIDHGGNQSNGTKNIKNVNFVHKDVQKIISWRKTLKKYNEQ